MNYVTVLDLSVDKQATEKNQRQKVKYFNEIKQGTILSLMQLFSLYSVLKMYFCSENQKTVEQEDDIIAMLKRI